MKDSELRGIVLKKFYQERGKDKYFPKVEDFPENDIDSIFRISSQLKEHGLLKVWKSVGRPATNGFGEISADGVDVIEGTKETRLAISITNNNHNVSVGNISNSSSLAIGSGNTISIENNINEIVEALKASGSSDEEIQGALKLLKKFITHPLVNTMVGASFGLL